MRFLYRTDTESSHAASGAADQLSWQIHDSNKVAPPIKDFPKFTPPPAPDVALILSCRWIPTRKQDLKAMTGGLLRGQSLTLNESDALQT